MKLSVVIITKNEERNIERCLKSIVEVADEIIVVDSFSTDNTIAICEKYDVKVIQRKFDGYGSQKQYATEQASFDYVLSLDADEELTTELKKSILAAKEKSGYDCYSFNRMNFFCNKEIHFCGWSPDKQIRLFNKHVLNWNNRTVHELIEVTNKQTIFNLSGDLNHYTCSSIGEQEEKAEKYARISADIIANRKKSISCIIPVVKFCFVFFKTYVINLGILDGYYGFEISRISAKSSFNKYALARKIIKQTRK